MNLEAVRKEVETGLRSGAFGTLEKDRLEEQLRAWAERVPPQLSRPAVPGDGMSQPEERTLCDWEATFEEEQEAGRYTLAGMVPAAGAATRMLQPIRDYLGEGGHGESGPSFEVLEKGLAAGRIPWLKDEERTRWGGQTQAERKEVLRNLLKKEAGFERCPKGLLPFHRVDGKVETAADGHLHRLEGLRWGRTQALLHLCVDARHLALWNRWRKEVLEEKHHAVDISFSTQGEQTRTFALKEDGGALVREDDGRPLLRPGGHGALLSNLQGLASRDLVTIRNVDNLSHPEQAGDAQKWQRRLLGALCRFLRMRNGYLLGTGDESALLGQIRAFLKPFLGESSLPGGGAEKTGLRSWTARYGYAPWYLWKVKKGGDPSGLKLRREGRTCGSLRVWRWQDAQKPRRFSAWDVSLTR